MSVTQTTADKKGISPICQKDALGYYYVPFGPVRLYFGTGDPDGIITAPIGSMYIDVTSARVSFADDAAGSWLKVTASDA